MTFERDRQAESHFAIRVEKDRETHVAMLTHLLFQVGIIDAELPVRAGGVLQVQPRLETAEGLCLRWQRDLLRGCNLEATVRLENADGHPLATVTSGFG